LVFFFVVENKSENKCQLRPPRALFPFDIPRLLISCGIISGISTTGIGGLGLGIGHKARQASCNYHVNRKVNQEEVNHGYGHENFNGSDSAWEPEKGNLKNQPKDRRSCFASSCRAGQDYLYQKRLKIQYFPRLLAFQVHPIVVILYKSPFSTRQFTKRAQTNHPFLIPHSSTHPSIYPSIHQSGKVEAKTRIEIHSSSNHFLHLRSKQELFGQKLQECRIPPKAFKQQTHGQRSRKQQLRRLPTVGSLLQQPYRTHLPGSKTPTGGKAPE